MTNELSKVIFQQRQEIIRILHQDIEDGICEHEFLLRYCVEVLSQNIQAFSIQFEFNSISQKTK